MNNWFGLVVVLVYVVLLPLLRTRSAQKKSGGKREGRENGSSAYEGTYTAPDRRETQTADRPQTGLRGFVARRRKDVDDEFDYGQASHRYSHVSDKRVEQLKSYLNAGLIDKKEYQQMLERYSREENCFDDQ